DVFNILLQVLDDGRITDSQGRKVDFKNTIIIMTSNAGAQSIVEPKRLGFGAHEDENEDHERMKAGVMEEVKRIFRPEFLNRIDETIVFRSLGRDDLKQIVGLLATELAKRCKEQLDVELVVRDAAKAWLVDESFDRKYGARPLKRKLQEEVEDPLSEMVISGEISRGDRAVVTVKDHKICISREAKKGNAKK
ncbi:MAG: AAA family ATPase, partial [Clostridiales bacterium]|nr:AAA family ATPase [Clostridiales bacterium]